MKRIKFEGLVMFLLFFGIALFEGLPARNWLKAGFWLAIGAVFLIADNFKKIAQH